MEVLNGRTTVLDLIKSVSEENGISNYVIADVKTNQKGEGYLGEIFMVTVKDSISGKQIEFVIKAAFEDEKVREMGAVEMSFKNEIYYYTTVLPTFEKFDRNCGVSKIAQLVPKCFEVRTIEKGEMLALENLKTSGFEIFEKTQFLDDDHVALIFKAYGYFHAYSFAMRDQKPEEYAKLVSNVHNVYDEFLNTKYFGDYLTHISGIVEKAFTPGEDDQIIRKYQSYSGGKIVDVFHDVINADCKHSVLLHGDCWSNNMMFKYENTSAGKRPVEIRLIDWQLAKVGSPVCDLSYCLYSGASKKVFDNLNKYLNIYYDSLSAHLKQLGSDPEKLYPFVKLKAHWQKYSRFGMIMSFPIIRMKLTLKQDILDFTDINGHDDGEIERMLTNMRVDEESFNKRIKGLLWHMSEINAL